MKIKSFGCSFLSGEELSSPLHSWPCLVAQDLGVPYQNYAVPGVGNFYIWQSILSSCSPGDFVIVGWTWIDRFDFCGADTEQWQTLRPVLDHVHAPFYFRNLHGQYKDMLSSLLCIQSTVAWLKAQGIDFLMTYIDDLIFENVDPSWHNPVPVKNLQKAVAPFLTDYHGKNFIDWSKENQWPISKSLHPLDQAHNQAAKFWKQDIEAKLNK